LSTISTSHNAKQALGVTARQMAAARILITVFIEARSFPTGLNQKALRPSGANYLFDDAGRISVAPPASERRMDGPGPNARTPPDRDHSSRRIDRSQAWMHDRELSLHGRRESIQLLRNLSPKLPTRANGHVVARAKEFEEFVLVLRRHEKVN